MGTTRVPFKKKRWKRTTRKKTRQNKTKQKSVMRSINTFSFLTSHPTRLPPPFYRHETTSTLTMSPRKKTCPKVPRLSLSLFCLRFKDPQQGVREGGLSCCIVNSEPVRPIMLMDARLSRLLLLGKNLNMKSALLSLGNSRWCSVNQ